VNVDLFQKEHQEGVDLGEEAEDEEEREGEEEELGEEEEPVDDGLVEEVETVDFERYTVAIVVGDVFVREEKDQAGETEVDRSAVDGHSVEAVCWRGCVRLATLDGLRGEVKDKGLEKE